MKILWDKIRAKKEYEILKITENKEEYLIQETYWICNISVWHKYIGLIGGEVPFNDYFLAREKMKELEKIENKTVLNREILFVWSFVFILLAVLGGYVICKL